MAQRSEASPPLTRGQANGYTQRLCAWRDDAFITQRLSRHQHRQTEVERRANPHQRALAIHAQPACTERHRRCRGKQDELRAVDADEVRDARVAAVVLRLPAALQHRQLRRRWGRYQATQADAPVIGVSMGLKRQALPINDEPMDDAEVESFAITILIPPTERLEEIMRSRAG